MWPSCWRDALKQPPPCISLLKPSVYPGIPAATQGESRTFPLKMDWRVDDLATPRLLKSPAARYRAQNTIMENGVGTHSTWVLVLGYLLLILCDFGTVPFLLKNVSLKYSSHLPYKTPHSPAFHPISVAAPLQSISLVPHHHCPPPLGLLMQEGTGAWFWFSSLATATH